MPNVVISLSKNKLKASVVVSKNVGKVVSREIFTQVFELPNEVANDTRILFLITGNKNLSIFFLIKIILSL